MDRIWSFLSQVFAIATQNSFRLGVRISRIHLNAMNAYSGDAFVTGLFNIYKVVHLNYMAKYNAWKAQLQQQLADTAAMELLFKQLGYETINAWDVAIANVYAITTVRYKALFPHGHNPFQSGSYEDRLAAIEALLLIIGADASLTAIKSTIETFRDNLVLAINTAKTSIETTTRKSNELETARLEMCDAQYGDLGDLMSHFRTTRDVIGDFFDLLTIRNITQMLFQGTVKTVNVHTIVERTVDGTAQLILENDGTTELRFYLSLVKNGVIGATFVTVAASATATVPVSSLGDAATMHFLMVYNPDATDKGHFTVEFL